MSDFFREIKEQPKALSDTLTYILQYDKVQMLELHEKLVKNEISRLIFTGMGSSYFASYLSYYFLNKKGIHAEMREAGEFLADSFPEDQETYFRGSALVIISQSGESGEITQLVKKFSRIKNHPLCIGITNNQQSFLAKNADIVFLTKAGTELSVTSKTYVSTLLVIYIFSYIISQGSDKLDRLVVEINSLIAQVGVILEGKDFTKILSKLVPFFAHTSHNLFLEILSKGPSLSTAFQAALNYKEIVKQPSEASPCSTFRHGGIESLHDDSKLIIISNGRESFLSNNRLIKNILKEWECGFIFHITNQEITAIDNSASQVDENNRLITWFHNTQNPYLSPLMEIVLLQLLFYQIAEKRGLIPGKFRFSQKITKEI